MSACGLKILVYAALNNLPGRGDAAGGMKTQGHHIFVVVCEEGLRVGRHVQHNYQAACGVDDVLLINVVHDAAHVMRADAVDVF